MKATSAVLLAVLSLASARPAAAESADYLFRLHCSGCHGSDGAGSKLGRIPPFAGIVGHFAQSPAGRLYLARVPGVANAGLPDAATADLLNYVLRNWGGGAWPANAPEFTPAEVNRLRTIHVDDIAGLRRSLAAGLARRGISTDY
jgi:mono/diheme cytochrome c family protein